MSDYPPVVYLNFRDRFPTVAAALDQLGRATEAAGTLQRPQSARRRRQQRRNPSRCHLAITTVGFPATVAALGRVDEVLEATSRP
jgi:hypothetical protein